MKLNFTLLASAALAIGAAYMADQETDASTSRWYWTAAILGAVSTGFQIGIAVPDYVKGAGPLAFAYPRNIIKGIRK